jgi:flagellar protein FliO/FliZ
MDAFLRVIIALVLVVGAMWVLAKVAKRPLRKRAANTLDVLARAQLSRNASVVVVRVDGTALVVGVTDGGVSLLHQLDAQAFAVTEPTSRTAVDLESITSPAAPTATPATVPATVPPALPAATPKSALAGSALSPGTWRQAIEALRERTARGA